MPCLSAIGCALSPDYSYIQSALQMPDSNNQWSNNNNNTNGMHGVYGEDASYNYNNNNNTNRQSQINGEEVYQPYDKLNFRVPFEPQPLNTAS